MTNVTHLIREFETEVLTMAKVALPMPEDPHQDYVVLCINNKVVEMSLQGAAGLGAALSEAAQKVEKRQKEFKREKK